MSGMTLLHSPALWAVLVLIGVVGLLGDTAWRSWTFPGRVEDPAVMFARPAPTRARWPLGPEEPPRRHPFAPTLAEWPIAGPTSYTLMARAGVDVEYQHEGVPVVVADWSARGGDFMELYEMPPARHGAGPTAGQERELLDFPAVPERTEAGATEDWSPIAEVAEAGRSLEDWLSERLQRFDEALHWIDNAPRAIDGTAWHPPMVLPPAQYLLTTGEHFEQFVSGSQKLHAYRELRIGATGEFTTRQHMELEALLGV